MRTLYHCRYLCCNTYQSAKWILYTAFIMFTLATSKAQDFEFECPTGWELQGSQCYKLFKRKLEYADAVSMCKRYGAKLVDIYGFQDNRNIAHIAKSQNANQTEYWIEPHKTSGNINQEEGFWDIFQPDRNGGSCVKVSTNDRWYYKSSWSFIHCKEKLAYVCEATACLKGSFRCANGQRCINKKFLCDGKDNCGDFSDEADCSARCTSVKRTSSGTVQSPNYPNAYNASSSCEWLIEAPENVRLVLQFTDFDTERGPDEVKIWVGGKTEVKSTFYTRLSGNYTLAQLQNMMPIVSPNNLMIIKFTSDATTHEKGFKASFGAGYTCHMMKLANHYQRGNVNQRITGTVDACKTQCLANATCDVFHYNKSGGYCETFRHVMPAFVDSSFDYYGKVCPGEVGSKVLPHIPEDGGELKAQPGPMPGFLQSPFYPFYMLGSMRSVWIVTTTTKLRKVITFELQEMNIGTMGAYVEIRDGKSPSSPLLARYADKSGPSVVMTTTGTARVYFYSKTMEARKGMQFWYREGCNVKLTGKSGTIQSPGYGIQGLQYPSYQQCSWTIQPQQPQSMIMNFESAFELKDGDVLKVYDGSDVNGTLLINVNGTTTAPSIVTSSSGSFYVTMQTNAIINGDGWKATYATNCPLLNFNSDTSTTALRYNYLDSIIVTCQTGYYFGQEEHLNSSMVTLQCGSNGWNVARIPQCKPVYCGTPPEVKNGYVKSSTGVTYQKTVTYDCYGGFTLMSSPNITCNHTGSWSQPPTCQSANCTELADVANSNKTVKYLDGVSYSSIVQYDCHPGYQLVGIPILQCLSGGQWSNSGTQPNCTKLQCLTPTIPHATLSLSKIEFEDVAVVTCNSGYKINGSSALSCQADQTLNTSLPLCVDIDECTDNADNCTQDCVNTDGSFECTCRQGYMKNMTVPSQCDDVDECAQSNGGCSPRSVAQCQNTVGSYYCTCPSGYDLYANNGTSNLYIPTPENGLTKGDVLHINHTCVRKSCPSLSASITHGKILTSKKNFYYEDVVHFMCDFGYVLNGSANITCRNDGTWSAAQPSCVVATCSPLNVTGLNFPPLVSYATDPIVYDSVATLTCNHSRPTPKTFQRKCIYDMTSNSYIIQDANLDCPVIDCGTPRSGPGQLTPTPASTLYGSSYMFNCTDQSTLIGNNSKNTLEVTCMEDGNWDVGDMRCKGKTCTDPGRPAGGFQTATSYEQNSLVSFGCERSGFALNSSAPLLCEINNTTATWNSTVPECVDVENPVFVNCPDNGTLDIAPLTAPNFVVPNATDNAAVRTLEVSPPNFRPDQILNENKTVTYTATDYAGNVATCVITIKMKDVIPPVITCPNSSSVQVADNNTQTVLSSSKPATATDNSGVIPVVTYSPMQFQVSAANFSDSITVTATATDGAGNSASCTYAVAVESSPCNPWTLPAPTNGTKQCSRKATNNGYDCVMTCSSGQYFYDGTNTKTFSCNDSQAWSPSQIVEPCQEPDRSSYSLTNRITYTASSNQAINMINTTACANAYLSSYIDALNSTSYLLTESCQNDITPVPGRYVEMSAASLQIDVQSDKVLVNFTSFILPNDLKDTEYKTCSSFIRASLLGVTFYLNTLPLRKIQSNTSSCPNLDVTSTVETLSAAAFMCQDSTNQKLVLKSDNNICLRCPAGTFTNSTGGCELCPVGMFSGSRGQSQCQPCPPGTWTEGRGAQQHHCISDCSAVKMVSPTRVMPCNGCPKNNYAVNSTTCVTCPAGTITRGTGNYNIKQCLAVCESGTYSHDGYEPCMSCPRNYYQSAQQQTSCDKCPTNQITLSEGATSSSNCTDAVAALCNSTICENNSTCRVANHTRVCDCLTGFTGDRCENDINDCASQPCYYGATCRDGVNSFTCTCPSTSGFQGLRCENETNDCLSSNCENSGMCQDQIGNFTCLCPAGFSGTRCQLATKYCDTHPGACRNGTCMNLGSTGYKCQCTPGFTGQTCDSEINECLSEPCLYGASCNNLVNDYSCNCPSGFSGKNCENRLDMCADSPCVSTGTCCDDYRTNQALCVCNQGFQSNSTVSAGTWFANINDVNQGQCTQTDLCQQASPCENGGTCNPGGGIYSCQCTPGFTGKNCQHNINECQSIPCQHGGTCNDMISGYNCTCPDGYEGVHCQTEINECNPDPCNVTGTVANGCRNLINDFSCQCKPGYRGKRCEIDIDDCAIQPCRHAGACTDMVDNFSCNCTAGWMGKQCESLVTKCTTNSCSNNATCVDIFDDSFCSCKVPFYGETCSSQESVCRDANPCLNNASCSDGNRDVKCSCRPGFNGDGCELDTNFCAGNPCNGGLCIASAEGATCQCLPGFEGSLCEKTIDVCQGVSCTAGTCVNGCSQCPVGKTGSICEKDVDRNFDFYFYNPDKTGSAYTTEPFMMNSTALSVGLWVRYESADDRGTFFSLYGMSSSNPGSTKTELIRIDNAGVTVNIGGDSRTLSFTENNVIYKINDAQWVYVLLSWDGASGKLVISFNNVKINEIAASYASGTQLPQYGWITLGNKYDSSNGISSADEGFNGYVTRVEVWNRLIDFLSPEAVPLISKTSTSVISNGLTQSWSDYTHEGGVITVRPSTLNQTVVRPVKSGLEITCPADQFYTSSERLTTATWSDPTHKGSSAPPEPSVHKDSVFIWGRHPVMYRTTDAEGNTATCSFHVLVRKNDCSDPPAPSVGGSQNCPSMSGRKFKSCSPQCTSNTRFPVPSPDRFTCGPQGSFNVFNKFLPFSYPSCAPARVNRVNVQLKLHFSISCTGGLDYKKGKILTKVQELDYKWKNSQNVGGLCKGQRCQEVLTVNHQCSANNVQMDLMIPDVENYLSAGSNNLTAQQVFLQSILDLSDFDFGGEFTGGTADLETADVIITPACYPGEVFIKDRCVTCGPGTMYNSITMTCELCPIGSYQSQNNQSSCTPCQQGTTTVLMGSTQMSDCKVNCTVGSFFNETAAGCSPCEKGFYQDMSGQFYCKPCSAENTTAGTGSTSSSDCFNECPDGTELQSDGKCQTCPRGTYRKLGSEATCVPCPEGKTTPTNGSVLRDECNITICNPGNFRNISNLCEPCPIGQYQPLALQDSCMQCNSSLTTLQTGSVNDTECVFFCIAGYEIYPRSTENCRPCELGYYKEASNLTGECHKCPDGFVTPGTASVSQENCTVLDCQEGNKADNGTCVPCELGTYQPQKYQSMCLACPPGNSTRTTGSVNITQCEPYCQSGYEMNSIGQCKPCEVGFYKDNTGGLFGMCTLCPSENITVGIASISLDNCTVANCSAGYKRNVTRNVCQACPRGFYQPMKWQINCTQCPTDQNTDQEISTDISQCNLVCPPGKDDQNDTCVNCEVGYYKEVRATESCSKCNDSSTGHELLTNATGATSASLCIIEKCRAGEERRADQKCYLCQKGYYNEKDEGSLCTHCPNDNNGTPKITFIEGATNASQCVLDCPSGTEHDASADRCVDCQRGYYRNKTEEDKCMLCPNNKITATSKAVSVNRCTVANCTAGNRRNATTETCIPCEKGSYQDQKWKDNCNTCGSDKTTENPGSTNISQCILDCAEGKEVDATGAQCKPCEVGYYRNKTMANPSLYCQLCPVQYITPFTGANSLSDCTRGNCTAGFFRNGEVCVPCPRNQYQDGKWQTSCKNCPDNTPTSDGQAQAVSECYNPCDKATCNANADCSVKNKTAVCRCKSAFQGDGQVCTGLCELSYCKNGGTCTPRPPDLPVCSCTDRWEGNTCNKRKEPFAVSPYIIGGSVGGVLLLLLLLLLFLAIAMCARRKPKKPVETNIINPVYEPLPGMTKPVSRFGSVTGSMAQMQPVLAATGAPSMSGFSHRSKYLYYEDVDDTPIQMGSIYEPSGTANHVRPPLPEIYEEKASVMNFGDEVGEDASPEMQGQDNRAYVQDGLYATVTK